MKPQIFAIFPYRHQDTWCFDDASRELEKEPFVMGVPELIDLAVRSIPNSEEGFRLKFSDKKFAKKCLKLTWISEDCGWNRYRTDDGRECTFCPSLLLYFETAPRELYAKAEGI